MECNVRNEKSIVHDYGNVDLRVVYETLKNDIPDLLEMVMAQ